MKFMRALASNEIKDLLMTALMSTALYNTGGRTVAVVSFRLAHHHTAVFLPSPALTTDVIIPLTLGGFGVL